MEKKKKHSFTSLNKDGVIKRTDSGYFIRPKDLVTVWNARIHNQRWEESIVQLTDYLREGGQVPPLEVRVNESTGAVEIVEGHRRHESYGRLIAEGVPEGWIQIVPFAGNDADRIARIATSNNQLELMPLEKAKLYKQLAALNLKPDEIAKLVCKSRQHVDDHLLLAYANTDVRNLVGSGHVSADTAICFVRQHGEEAGARLEAELQRARGQGKDKVTKGTVKGRSLPQKIVSGYIASADSFAASLSTEVHTKLYQVAQLKSERGEEVTDDETVTVEISIKALSEFLESHGNAEAARSKQAEKQRQREARAAQGELMGADE